MVMHCTGCGAPITPEAFRPGDRIVRHLRSGTRIEYTVADPPYSRAGKVRLITMSGTIMTTWWERNRVPSGYYVVGPLREEVGAHAHR